jgi:hypothetical protein
MKRVLAALTVLLVELLLYLAFARATGRDVVREGAPVSSLALRERELEPLPERPATTRARAELAPEPAAAVTGSSAEPGARPAPHDVRVLVLFRDTRQPVVGVDVRLAWWPPSDEVADASGMTDASGAVGLRLPARSAALPPLCAVVVRTEDVDQVFRALPLREELVVLVEACTRLHGRIVAHGLDAGARAWVQFDEPARGAMSVPVMLTRAQSVVDGAFEVRACPSREIPAVDVRVSIASITVTRRVPWEELASEAGALIELHFGECTVRVVDEQGAALPDANVRISPVGEGDPFPAVGVTDARGEFRATLEPGVCDVVAGLDGHASAIERIEVGAHSAPILLRLRRLGPTDRLRGRVVREDRTPIEDAIVTAAPATEAREAAVAAFVQQRSGADGSFELAIEEGRELTATAFHRDVGISDELHFLPDGREIELVIRPQGTLEVRVAPPPDFAGHAGGLVEYVLVDRRLAHVDRGHDFRVPFELYQVPVGDYNLFVFVAAWSAYAEGSVHVAAGRSTTVELVARPAQFARGTVRAADGLPCTDGRLVLEHPTWPSEVEDVWSTALDARGRFELLLGEETACPARVVRRDAPPRRVELHAGDDNE